MTFKAHWMIWLPLSNHDLDRNAFLEEVDMLSSVLVPELKSEAGTWAIPLIKAGAWLEGFKSYRLYQKIMP